MSTDRPFGPGWYWQFDMNLTGELIDPGTVLWKSADGSEYEFEPDEEVGDYLYYTSPAGMHTVILRRETNDGYFELLIGKLTYRFDVNEDDERARLVWIRNQFGNGIEINRPLDGNSQPEATISIATSESPSSCILAGSSVGRPLKSFSPSIVSKPNW